MAKTPKPLDEVSWLITWRPNSEYVGQSKLMGLPGDHTETIIHYGDMEDWVKNNLHKSVMFCCRLA